ncbi:MAG: DUF815 domain-containing protein [Clostridia bacterium]
MKNIKNIGFMLSNISIYSEILNDDVFINLKNIISNEHNSAFDASNAYSKMFKLLCTSEHIGNLYDYIYDKVIYAENLFTLECAKGNFKNLPEHIVEASKNDLAILYKIAKLTSEQLIDYLIENYTDIKEISSLMPKFSNTPKNSDDFGDWGENLSHFVEHNEKNGYGLYSRYIFFYLDENGPTIKPVLNPDNISLDNLKCFEAQRKTIVDNTLSLINGSKINNVLLYGHRGTGKSSTIKAIVNDFHTNGLRLIEVSKENLKYLGRVIDVLSKIPMKFIVFVDDLTFTDGDDSYTALKAVLEGSSNKLGDNMALYATTNRRHLVTETFMSREGDEVHLKDTLDETASLSDRFGIMVTFSFPSRLEYLEIVKQLAIDNNLSFEKIETGAISWSAQRGNFSPRTARQYIDFVIAQNRG